VARVKRHQPATFLFGQFRKGLAGPGGTKKKGEKGRKKGGGKKEKREEGKGYSPGPNLIGGTPGGMHVRGGKRKNPGKGEKKGRKKQKTGNLHFNLLYRPPWKEKRKKIDDENKEKRGGD